MNYELKNILGAAKEGARVGDVNILIRSRLMLEIAEILDLARKACEWRTDKYQEIPLYLQPLCDALIKLDSGE